MYIMMQNQQPCLPQEVFTYGTRRLLLQIATSPPTSNFTDPPPFDTSSFDMNSHFSPSMAIILVVLLSAFFFMGFFSVYVRRCTTEEDPNDMRRDIHNMNSSVVEQQGLDPAMVANLPMVAYSANIKKKGCNECVVCLTEFEEDEPLKLLPKCKHAFHTECIDMWLFSHTTCPLCRRSLVGGGSTRSFRWGSSRRSSFNWNNEGSSRGGRQQQQMTELVPPEVQLTVMDETGASRPPLPRSGKRRALRRSNSTGHSLLRRAWSRTALFSTPSAAALVAASPDVSSGTTAAAEAAMHRSRSVSAVSGSGGEHEEVGSTAEGGRPRLNRGWSVSQLRRALSLRSTQGQDAAAFSTPVGQAAADPAARRTFDRLGAYP